MNTVSTVNNSGVNLDVDAVRSYFADAISAYEDTATDFARQQPDLGVSDFGAGFAEQGQRITTAVQEVYADSLRLLQERTQQWEGIRSLAQEVQGADEDAADAISGVGGAW
ncbi:hypothetical protein BJP08_09450 [Corynebacterium sp. NML140438]|nr:hypothetical protein BJP08_09450 [Corynebacterium sp. NML140438]